jgi:hypothetical protein
MDMHFTQWDEDKYAELSKQILVLARIGANVCLSALFLFNNYKQVDAR